MINKTHATETPILTGIILTSLPQALRFQLGPYWTEIKKITALQVLSIAFSLIIINNLVVFCQLGS